MEKWQAIFDALTAAGIETYAPGGHMGICTSPYCVVQPCGKNRQNSSALCCRASYRIYMVVPCDEPASMGILAEQVRTALSELVQSGAIEPDLPQSTVDTDSGFMALISWTDYNCYYSERN